MDKAFWDNFINNVLQSWVVPELNRREAAGSIPPDFSLYAAQIITEAGTPTPEIRLNEEVAVVLGLAKDSPLADVETGRIADFGSVAPYIVCFDLADDDRPNAGHITIIRNGAGWFATFDLRYNADRIAEHIVAAREFLDAASDALGIGRMRVFAADCFAAVDLIGKARLMLHPDERVLRSRKHNSIISNYNIEANRGNVRQEFAQLLNRLDQLRNVARYPIGTFTVDMAEGRTLLEGAEDMYSETLKMIR